MRIRPAHQARNIHVYDLSQTCFEAYTHRLYMCADVVMLIRDVATRDMVEDKLFWDASKEGGRGRCIKFPGLPSTTPPLLEGDRLCPSRELPDVARFVFF